VAYEPNNGQPTAGYQCWLGKIAIEIEFSLAPLTCRTSGLAEISNFIVFRMPLQSVAPLKAEG
jgi:hypothetical protein